MDKKDQEILDNCEKLHQALIVTQSNLSKRFTNPKGSKSMNNMFSKLGSIKPVEKSETESDSSIQQETSVEVDNSSLNAKSVSKEVAEQEQVQNDFSVTNEKVVDVTESSSDVAIDNSVDETEKKSDIKGSLDEGQPMADDSLLSRKLEMYFKDNGGKVSIQRNCPLFIGQILKCISLNEKVKVQVLSVNIVLDWYVFNQEWFSRTGHADSFGLPEGFNFIRKPAKKSLFDGNVKKFPTKPYSGFQIPDYAESKNLMFNFFYKVGTSNLAARMVLDWISYYEPVLSKKQYWKDIQGILKNNALI